MTVKDIDKNARIYGMTRTESERNVVEWRGVQLTLRGDSHEDWNNIRRALAHPRVPIARIEFFNYPDRHPLAFKGAVIFDAEGKPLVHTANALLGYGGQGAILSQKILEMVGAGDLYRDITSYVTTTTYRPIIVSRETTIGAIADLSGKVEDTWRWDYGL